MEIVLGICGADCAEGDGGADCVGGNSGVAATTPAPCGLPKQSSIGYHMFHTSSISEIFIFLKFRYMAEL